MWLYLQLVDHPTSKIKYTVILDNKKNNRKLCLLSYMEYILKVIRGIIIIDINKDRAGVIYEIK